MPKKIILARLEFSRFLIKNLSCSGDLSDNESEEKHYVAICGGSICILTTLLVELMTMREMCQVISRPSTCLKS